MHPVLPPFFFSLNSIFVIFLVTHIFTSLFIIHHEWTWMSRDQRLKSKEKKLFGANNVFQDESSDQCTFFNKGISVYSILCLSWLLCLYLSYKPWWTKANSLSFYWTSARIVNVTCSSYTSIFIFLVFFMHLGHCWQPLSMKIIPFQ